MEELPSEPKQEDERFVEPSNVEPQTEKTRADAGTKLFVLFFFLIVPPLGIVLVAAVCWKAYRLLSGT